MLFARSLPILCILFLAVSGCAGNHPAAADSQTQELIVRDIVYDAKGLPSAGPRLPERPTLPGDHYTVLVLSHGSILESCDIAVAAGRADFRKPFQAIYEWTGKGFEVGLEASSVLARGMHSGSYSGEEALVTLAIVFTPVAIGGVTGFIIGIGDGVVQTAVEMRKVVLDPNEQVLTCTLYDYDHAGRLHRMRMVSPDRKRELVRTTFEYEGNGTGPARTTVESLVEGRTRDIR